MIARVLVKCLWRKWVWSLYTTAYSHKRFLFSTHHACIHFYCAVPMATTCVGDQIHGSLILTETPEIFFLRTVKHFICSYIVSVMGAFPSHRARNAESAVVNNLIISGWQSCIYVHVPNVQKVNGALVTPPLHENNVTVTLSISQCGESAPNVG